MHFFQAFLSFSHLYLDFILIAAPKIFPRKDGALLQVPYVWPLKNCLPFSGRRYTNWTPVEASSGC